jgi:hypothetical protein
MLDLATYRRNVFSAPSTALVYADGHSGALSPQEVLLWRRSG